MDELKQELEGYTAVICSTLNQMVNYIPLRTFKFKEVINITITGSKHCSNIEWDKNLKCTLKKNKVETNWSDNHITLDQHDTASPEEIFKKLEEALENNKEVDKIFWNITGGQRSILIAIYRLIVKNNRKDDYVCFLEGNKRDIIYIKGGGVFDFDNTYQEKKESYPELSVEEALGLSGFRITSELNNLLISNDEVKESLYRKLYKFYIDDIGREAQFREALIRTVNKEYFEEIKSNHYEQRDSIVKIVEGLSDEEEKLLEEHLNRNIAFGYMLEMIALYKIKELLIKTGKKPAKALYYSVKLRFTDDRKDQYANKKQLDEFDLLLLTKHGKLVVFECKSGGMTGDVAKSTNYSTYAAAGVYGKPILITPFLKHEIDKIKKREDDDCTGKNIYKNIVSAVKSANRAGLDCWGLDEIEDKLKKLLDI